MPVKPHNVMQVEGKSCFITGVHYGQKQKPSSLLKKSYSIIVMCTLRSTKHKTCIPAKPLLKGITMLNIYLILTFCNETFADNTNLLIHRPTVSNYKFNFRQNCLYIKSKKKTSISTLHSRPLNWKIIYKFLSITTEKISKEEFDITLMTIINWPFISIQVGGSGGGGVSATLLFSLILTKIYEKHFGIIMLSNLLLHFICRLLWYKVNRQLTRLVTLLQRRRFDTNAI